MYELLSSPWAWYVAGPLITLVMVALLLLGKRFGFSSNLKTLCAAGGAGKACSLFQFDWKKERWNLVFLLGAIIGGGLSAFYLTPDKSIALATETTQALQGLGFQDVGAQYLPEELFGTAALSSFKGWIILLIGGLLVGFGARYADGCTSGHAISGLSNLQIPSLIAVVGFFIGGLLMVHVLFPILFSN